MKQCPSCGLVLDHAAFHISRTSPDGLQSYCKLCQRRYREKHPSKEWKLNKEKTTTTFFDMDMHTDCRYCLDTHKGVNGLYCDLLDMYVEHQKQPPCKRVNS